MNKYRNIKTEVNGIMFHSKKEAHRYSELLLLERAGKIRELKLQPRFDLAVNGQKICYYLADFEYEENGKRVVEDVKGRAGGTDMYRIKKKLVRAIWGIEIQEV